MILYLSLSDGKSCFQKNRVYYYGILMRGIIAEYKWELFNIFKLYYLIKKNNIKYIKTDSVLAAALVGVLLKKITGAKLVVRSGGRYNYKNKIKNFIAIKLENWALKHIDRLVVNSKYLQNEYWKKGIKSTLIYNGVNKNIFKYKKHKFNTKKLIYVGRLVENKGLGYLLKAIKGTDYKLTIVGKGNFIKKQKNVTYVGFKTHKEIKKLFDEHDIMVFPTTSESSDSFPNAVLEALASGLMVIASDVKGLPEILNHYFLFKEKSSMAIRLLLDDIYNNIDFYKDKMSYNFKSGSQLKHIEDVGGVLFGKM